MVWQGESPWKGDQFGSEIYRSKIPLQALEVRPNYPFLPLQHLPEALVELLLDQAK